MSKSIALLATLSAVSVGAFAQGAAEAAMSHAMSTSLGTAAGKALGSATNQMTNRVAGRLGQQPANTAPPGVVTHVKPGVQGQTQTVQAVTATTAQPPEGGSLIRSIQGAAPQTCVNTAPNDQQSPDAKDAGKNTKKSACPAPTVKYQSEITLPAPK